MCQTTLYSLECLPSMSFSVARMLFSRSKEVNREAEKHKRSEAKKRAVVFCIGAAIMHQYSATCGRGSEDEP